VKKHNEDIKNFSSDLAQDKTLDNDKFKTTNVNVLLNRVRLDKKRTLKKRIVFSLTLAVIVSSLAIYFII
jgi:hypothetical protein